MAESQEEEMVPRFSKVLHAIFAACIGFFGVNCSQPCPDGYFGHGCRQVCNCNDTESCNAEIGCIAKIETYNGMYASILDKRLFRHQNKNPTFSELSVCLLFKGVAKVIS